MEFPRYRVSRQTVCGQCSTAKTRCIRGLTGFACARCSKRGLRCTLAASKDGCIALAGTVTPFQEATLAGEHMRVPKESASHHIPEQATPAAPSSASSNGRERQQLYQFDFSALDLVCSIDADGISNRWLNPYIPAPGQKRKAYDSTITSFIQRNLKSYTAIAVHGRGLPPFVHPLQLDRVGETVPLQTCLNIVRLLERSTQADPTAADILKHEMTKIFENRHTFGTVAGLAAYQAYLLYAMALYFWVGEPSAPYMVEAMMHLQELASITAKHGIVCSAEQRHIRPRWEEWIIAEAQRRTIYVMYLFDGMLSAQDGLPSFLGTELEGLQAPACQSLWYADKFQDWERKYNAFLAAWSEGYLVIDELWSAPPSLDSAALAKRHVRVDQWLEDVDRFGTMLFAVTSYVHKN